MNKQTAMRLVDLYERFVAGEIERESDEIVALEGTHEGDVFNGFGYSDMSPAELRKFFTVYRFEVYDALSSRRRFRVDHEGIGAYQA